MSGIVDSLLGVPPGLAYAIIGLLVFAEAAVFVGRFTAFLRTVMPGLAGASRMPYGRFLVFNAAGGLAWGVGVLLLGCSAGASYATVERSLGRGTAIAAAVFLLAAAGLLLRHRPRAQARPPLVDDAASL